MTLLGPLRMDPASFFPLAIVSALAEPLEGGQRGGGQAAGEPGLGTFPAGEYPACSSHGAMNRLSRDRRIFRCLAEGLQRRSRMDAALVTR